MKFIFISIKIIFLYFISFSSSYSIEAPNIKNLIIYEEKQKIKFFDFLNEAGNKVNLKDFKSELIILNFWATWCAPCREEMPSLNNLQILKDEKKIVLNVYRSKLVIINFWATWCAPCKEEMPHLDKLKSKSKFQDIEILPINISDEELTKSEIFFKELNINNLEIFYGSSIGLAKEFKLRGIPTTILIDKEGYEFARIIGFIDFENKSFLDWLSKHL